MIYLYVILFLKQTLYFNSSLLQGGLPIAQAPIMAFTSSTVIANDNVAASIIVGANISTVI